MVSVASHLVSWASVNDIEATVSGSKDGGYEIRTEDYSLGNNYD